MRSLFHQLTSKRRDYEFAFPYICNTNATQITPLENGDTKRRGYEFVFPYICLKKSLPWKTGTIKVEGIRSEVFMSLLFLENATKKSPPLKTGIRCEGVLILLFRIYTKHITPLENGDYKGRGTTKRSVYTFVFLYICHKKSFPQKMGTILVEKVRSEGVMSSLFDIYATQIIPHLESMDYKGGGTTKRRGCEVAFPYIYIHIYIYMPHKSPH